MNKPNTIEEITEQWHEMARAKEFDHYQARRMALDHCRQYLQSLFKAWTWSERVYAISLSDCRTIFGRIMRPIEPRKREATLAIMAAG